MKPIIHMKCSKNQTGFSQSQTLMRNQNSSSRKFCTVKSMKVGESGFPDPFILPPAAPRRIYGSIIWLHGITNNPASFTDLWFLSLKPKYFRMILPVGNSYNLRALGGNTASAWFDHNPISTVADLEQNSLNFNEEQFQKSAEYITKLIDHEASIVPANTILLGGVGQGAAVALHAGLLYPKALGGLISCNGFLLPKYLSVYQRQPQQRSTSTLVLHGSKYDKVPLSIGEYTDAKLRECVSDVDFQVDEEGSQEVSKIQRGALSAYFGNPMPLE